MVPPRRFPELEARPWFATARISVVVTGGQRAARSDAVTCGFPHRPRRFYRQPFADAALEHAQLRRHHPARRVTGPRHPGARGRPLLVRRHLGLAGTAQSSKCLGSRPLPSTVLV